MIINPLTNFRTLYITDLTFIEDGNSSSTERGGINFIKRTLQWNVIKEFKQFQQICDFSKVGFSSCIEPLKVFPKSQPLYQLISSIADVPAIEDKWFYDRSLYIFPRR